MTIDGAHRSPVDGRRAGRSDIPESAVAGHAGCPATETPPWAHGGVPHGPMRRQLAVQVTDGALLLPFQLPMNPNEVLPPAFRLPL